MNHKYFPQSEADSIFDEDSDKLDDAEFNLAIKEDGVHNNQINNMVTDIYMANNASKKSNLKAVSMFDETPAMSQEEFNNRKRVKFNNENDPVAVANKKRKPNERSSKSDENKLELIKYFERFIFCKQFLKSN